MVTLYLKVNVRESYFFWILRKPTQKEITKHVKLTNLCRHRNIARTATNKFDLI